MQKELIEKIRQSGEIPLWGDPPSFPWDTFADQLAGALTLDEMKITTKGGEFKEPIDFFSGMGENHIELAIELSPLGEKAIWIMPESDVFRLSAIGLKQEDEAGFSDRTLKKGFYHYIALEAMRICDELRAIEDLNPKLAAVDLPRSSAYAIDIAIECDGQTLWGRLLLSEAFRKAYKAHFSTKKRPLSSSMELLLPLLIGSATLPAEKWQTISKGDFLILDRCPYDLKTKKGALQLAIASTPLFQVKLKEERIKILDYAHTCEEKPMTESNDDFLDEDEELTITDDLEDEEPEAAPTFEEAAPAQLISPEEVPVTINVEVTRLKMRLDQVLALKPGNTLDLSVRPEQGVTLTVNGRAVARGQLMQVGDVVGVKILEVQS